MLKKSPKTKIIISNTEFKTSYFWISVLQKLGILHRLSYEEVSKQYCLRNENRQLKALLSSIYYTEYKKLLQEPRKETDNVQRL